MKQDRFSKLDTAKIKGKYDFVCNECGSMENIQAHDPTGFHTNWRQGIALCGDCHSKQHPDVPKDLFLPSTHQPYWPNISARALAEEFGVHSRTIIRRAKRLAISPIYPLSDDDKERLRKPLMCVNLASENAMRRMQNSPTPLASTPPFIPRIRNAVGYWRQSLRMTDKELAKKAGIKLISLQLWENDLGLPSLAQMEQIGVVLGKSVGMLFDMSGGDIERQTNPINTC